MGNEDDDDHGSSIDFDDSLGAKLSMSTSNGVCVCVCMCVCMYSISVILVESLASISPFRFSYHQTRKSFYSWCTAMCAVR